MNRWRHMGRVLVLLATPALAATTSLKAQVSETPAAFDTSGQVRVLTPALVQRLALAAPQWPVRDDFVEARLFAVSDGSFVIAVQRHGGTVDRYQMSADQAAALREVVSTALSRGGRVVSEEGPSTISEPAGGAFVRNQMIAAAIFYGPAAAYLTHDGSAGTGVYLLLVGGSYFVLTNLSQSTTITKSQNDLATDGALRGAILLLNASNAAGVDVRDNTAAALSLIGGIGGSITGYQLGKGLTQSEARSMRAGSTLTGLTALGVGVATGALTDKSRMASGIAAAAGVLGYVLGPAYPRSAAYSVTAGDVDMVELTAFLGAATAAIPIADAHPSDQGLATVLTAGLVAGTVIGDRMFARPYDHTVSEASRVELGTFAGMLMGGAVPALMQSGDPALILGSITLGGILGTAAAENLVAPARAGSAAAGGERRGAMRLRFDPAALAMAASRAPGKYAVLSLNF